MKLHRTLWTPYPRRVTIYMAEKGITDVETRDLEMLRGEHKQADYLGINPVGTIPLLEVEPGMTMHESTAIIEYLEELYPEPNLIGFTAIERGRTRDMAGIVNDTCIYGLNHLAHVSALMSKMIDQKADVASAMEARYRLSLDRMEAMASDGAFLTGDRPTYADCLFFASFQYFDLLFGQPLPKQLTKLNQAYRRFSSRPSAAPPSYPAGIAELAHRRVG